MRVQQINRVSSRVILVLSFVALLAVFSGYFQPLAPPATDEGSAAHIFQIAIALLVLTLLVFIGTADRSQPRRSARPLVIPATALVVAFATLYYLEHYRYR